MTQFMWGAMAFASWIIGLIFLRSWKLSRDRLFAMFALAFWIMGVSWTALAIENPPRETQHYFYSLRLVAFMLILGAVIDKNRTSSRRR
jgi:hypothetical protein